jgi:aminopeptidase
MHFLAVTDLTNVINMLITPTTKKIFYKERKRELYKTNKNIIIMHMNQQFIKRSVENIFIINLAVKRNESTLVFTDTYNKKTEKIAEMIAETGNRFTNSIHYRTILPSGCHGTEPPEELWKAAFGEQCVQHLKQKKLLKQILAKRIGAGQLREAEAIIHRYKYESVRTVIALSYFSTSHTRFRDFLNRICGTRYASMPLFDEEMLKGAMNVDWENMSKRIGQISRAVDKCENIEIETPNGTWITFSRKGRPVMKDTGLITRPGSFSNLPAGEVFLAPLEGTAEGTLVLEWAPTRKLKRPIILTVEKGLVSKIEGKGGYVTLLNQKLSERTENGNIAEFGLGTNDRASRPDNILESEKIFGTIHIALGDNSSFGGKVSTQFHQDFVFFKPTVTLIYTSGYRKLLMKSGKILIRS